MNTIKTAAIVAASILSINVNAAALPPGDVLHIEAVALSPTDQTTYLPANTELHYSFNMYVADVSPYDMQTNPPLFPLPVFATSGTMTWNDGTDHTWNFTFGSLALLSMSSSGYFAPAFAGSGDTTNGYTIGATEIGFDLGVDLSTSTEKLYDLILNSSITDLNLFILTDPLHAIVQPLNIVSSTITPVPVPAAIWLFCFGLAGLAVPGFKTRRN